MAFVLKPDKKTIVPWFSMSEWNEVNNQIYSNDPVVQRKGYERLLVWKARCAILPAGVECTLELIHVCLQDQDVWPQIVSGALPPYREHDLRLMYSTAVMRFLNHISTLARDTTLYKMAKKLHIPDWVVNIRHDVAHGLHMPPLTLLREAVHLILEWIHENYWKGETELTTNYVGDIEEGNKLLIPQLQDYLELWQAIKLYQQAGHIEGRTIPDAELKLKLRQKLDINPKKGEKASTFNKCSSGGNLNNWKLIEVLDQLVSHLKTVVINNKECNADEMLVTLLLEGEAFLPGEHLLTMMDTGTDRSEISKVSLPIRFLLLWQDLLTSLQTVNILPILIEKLIEFCCKTEESLHRRQMAAIWIKEICKGILKVRKIHKFMKTFQPKKETNKKPEKQKIKNKIRIDFEEKHPQYKNVLTLGFICLPNINIAFLEKTMLSPNKWSYIFLPSLLDLVEPEIYKSTKDNLLNVLEIYTSEVVPIFDNELEQKTTPIYTVDSLVMNGYSQVPKESIIMEVDLEDEVNSNVETAQHLSDSWSRSETYLDWENCPLGVLPWQRNAPVVDLDLPRDTTWTPAQPLLAFKEANKKLSCIFQKKIDWKNIQELKKQSKKIKKLKRASGSNLVKKAFKTVIGI